VVVDTIETAQKCVEFLKNNNVGSATFIALDKQDKWKEQVKNRPNTPENVHRLVDLIQVKEEKFLTAFYYSLRNTLVANDLEQATRIAYGTPRYRVVTLKGEVIEMSGTMSGGGQPQRGRMGSRIVEEFSADKIKKLQDTLREDETAFKQTVERKRQVEPACHNLKTQMDKAKETLAKWKNELGSLKDQIKEYKKFEIACVKKIKEIVTDEAAQRRLEQALEAYKSQFEKADALAAKLRDENDQLHKKIVDISKKILDEPKANLKTIETKIGEANKEMTSLAVEIKTSKRNLITSEKKLASFKQDLEDYEAKVGKFQERTETIDDDLKQAKEQYDAVKLECDESEAEMKELVKHMKQLESKIQKLETEKIDLKHNIENSGSKLKQEEHQLKHYEGLLDSLKLHNIKELENMNLESTENNDMTKTNGGYELRKLDQDDLTGLEVEDLRKEVHKLEENLKNSNANLAAIQSYKELVSVF
jgi:structural maintenance of chromosome 4